MQYIRDYFQARREALRSGIWSMEGWKEVAARVGNDTYNMENIQRGVKGEGTE